MAKRVGQYRITRSDGDVDLIVDTIMFLIDKGKTNIYPYSNGQVCFSHRGTFWFVSPYNMMYSPRHRANGKWYKAENLEGIWEGINSWLDFKESKKKEKEALKNAAVHGHRSEQSDPGQDMGGLCQQSDIHEA
jgi:hypothetical protein